MQRRAGAALQLPSPVVELHDERLDRAGVRLLVKRDDLIHPEMPGNKWRKLKHNLAAAADEGHDTLLTFGGAYSNHVRATAAAGCYFGFRTVGVIRGEERLPLNPSLAYAVSCGMRLAYLDRTTYREKRSPAVDWHIEHGYHFGGFAKTTPQLIAFADDFAARHDMTLDRVYVAKMMFGVLRIIESGAFPRPTTIVAVVTG